MTGSREHGYKDSLQFLFLLGWKRGVQVDFLDGIILGLSESILALCSVSNSYASSPNLVKHTKCSTGELNLFRGIRCRKHHFSYLRSIKRQKSLLRHVSVNPYQTTSENFTGNIALSRKTQRQRRVLTNPLLLLFIHLNLQLCFVLMHRDVFDPLTVVNCNAFRGHGDYPHRISLART